MGKKLKCIKDFAEFKEDETYDVTGDIIVQTEEKSFILSDEFLKEYFVEINEDEKSGVKFDNDKLPYYTVLFKQFPNALREIVKCSKAGHNKYHKTDSDWMNFTRLDNVDIRYKDAMLRHMTEEGIVEDMKPYGEMTHEAAVVWNALADLEVKLRTPNN